MRAPQVSVVLSVRDDRGGLRRTLDSVLGQTLGDLELIVVDDGSQDATPQVLADCAATDERVVVLTNPENLGVASSANRGLRRARADLVARIDEGDVWAAEKLELQVQRMRAEPEVVLLGTQVDARDPASGASVPLTPLPTTDADLRASILRCNCPFWQPTVLFRRLEGVFYTETTRGGRLNACEDFELWVRLSFVGRIQNLATPLVTISYGPSTAGLSTRHAPEQFDLKTAVHQQLVKILTSGDRALAKALVRDGFELPSPTPAGRLRRASFRLREAGTRASFPGSAALRGLGYALDPPAIAHHVRNKLVLPLRLGAPDWCWGLG